MRVTVSTVAAPVNDDYASRTVVTTGVNVTGSNAGATTQAGELDVRRWGTGTYGSSVWYEWTAGNDCVFTVSTAGSSFSSILAVYRVGPTVYDATLVSLGGGSSQRWLVLQLCGCGRLWARECADMRSCWSIRTCDCGCECPCLARCRGVTSAAPACIQSAV